MRGGERTRDRERVEGTVSVEGGEGEGRPGDVLERRH